MSIIGIKERTWQAIQWKEIEIRNDGRNGNGSMKNAGK